MLIPEAVLRLFLAGEVPGLKASPVLTMRHHEPSRHCSHLNTAAGAMARVCSAALKGNP